MDKIASLTKKIIAFRDARDWRQFHNPKDLAISLTLEAAEVLEHFQWRDQAEVDAYTQTHKTAIAHELADVMFYLLQMCDGLNIDIYQACLAKLKINEKKYPVKKAKGRHNKYNQL